MLLVSTAALDNAPSDLNSAALAVPPPLTPFDIEQVTITRRELIALKMQASQYRSLHQRAVKRIEWGQRRHDAEMAQARSREATLRQALELAQAQLRDLRQRVFGARTERSVYKGAVPPAVSQRPHRPRGQQRGRRGHGRTRLSTLPVRPQDLTLDAQAAACPSCGLPLQEIAGTQDAEVLEIEVKAYRRCVRRHRYRPTCRCGVRPGLVMPAAPSQIIPRGKLGVSIWAEALLSKFLYGQPTTRMLQDWADHGLHVAQGTLTDGLHVLLPLFTPLARAGLEQLRRHAYWHADETRWEVFEELPGKIGHRWYLWVFECKQVVCFVMDPSRSASVPMTALQGVDSGVLSVDRYAAYRKFARHTADVKLAICWAHQRRDFLRLANDHPPLWDWSMAWVQQIARLYTLHDLRRQHADEVDGRGFLDSDRQLRELLQTMSRLCDAGLADPQLAGAARKVLRTLRAHWPGLVRFLDDPQIDLDNNAAERALRLAVVGRKNFYGSGSRWSGELAATMLSVLGTVRLWKINPRTWLSEYLRACADAGGRPPADLKAFVPWQMSPQRLHMLRGLPTIDSS